MNLNLSHLQVPTLPVLPKHWSMHNHNTMVWRLASKQVRNTCIDIPQLGLVNQQVIELAYTVGGTVHSVALRWQRTRVSVQHIGLAGQPVGS